MAEIDFTEILIAVTVALIGIGGTWIGSGILARSFEKKKRKYDVKLERYSVIARNLEWMFYSIPTWDSYYRLKESLDEGHVIEKGKIDPQAAEDFSDLCTSLMLVKRSVGLEVKQDYSELYQDKTILGIAEGELRDASEEKARQKLDDRLVRQNLDMVACHGIINLRLRRGIADISVIGSRALANRTIALMEGFRSEMLSPKPTEQRKREELRIQLDGIMTSLAEDLEETL